MKVVKYYYFGPQCYGYKYMSKGAREAADILGYDYLEIDISKEAVDCELYFPGNIIIDDFLIAYPGTGEEIVKGYHNKGAIEGEIGSYKKREKKEPLTIKPLIENITDGSIICLPYQSEAFEKKLWLIEMAKYTYANAGFIAYDSRPVAAVEFIREDIIPYNIPKNREDFLYITCIYNNPKLDYDYRYSLLDKLKHFAIDKGFSGISVTSGDNEPYPNGPKNFFIENGFSKIASLGDVLLKYQWDTMTFLEWKN